MKRTPSPPPFLLSLFSWFCKPALHKSIEGDLYELYNERLQRSGKWKADLFFFIDVVFLFRPGIVRFPELEFSAVSTGMVTNYFKSGFRTMMRYKVFSIINLTGLALAMSVCMLVILMLADQLRYDRFHSNADRIYRVISAPRYATSPLPLASTLKEEYSIIEESTNLTPGFSGDANYRERNIELRGYFTDAAFFRILGFELESGSTERSLDEPRSIVISKEIAQQLFRDEDPVGKVIQFSDRKLSFPQRFAGRGAPPVSWGEFTVTGVFDQSKYKSHLTFDVLASTATLPSLYQEKKFDDHSQSWDSYWRTYTFVLLHSGKTEADLNAALADVVAKKYEDLDADHLKGFTMTAQKMSAIQLDSKGNDTDHRMPGMIYYFLGGLALIIMLSACLNYTNLAIARALTRAREVGVRKVTGASRAALIFQFLSESILTAMFALAAAMLILTGLKPAFKNLWVNQHLNFELPETPLVYAVFVCFSLFIGLLSGLYPAIRLSSFKPVKALKALGGVKTGKMGLMKVLTVSQFIVSLFFITTTILIFNQVRHYMDFDYGFDPTNIVNVELQGADYQKVVTAFRNVKGVSTISASDLIPSTGTNNGNQFKRPHDDEEKYHFFSVLHVDENFCQNLKLTIVSGQDLSDSSPGEHVVLNEAAAKRLGYTNPHEAIGQFIESRYGSEQLTIVGVVKDFRYMLLINQHEVGGLMLRRNPDQFQYLNVRIFPHDAPATLAALEKAWKTIDPLHAIEYKFFETELSDTHQALFDIVSIISVIALLSIVISCLGLLGMTTYTAERKQKEVGIRKILGAGIHSIAFLLSRRFVVLLGIAVLIGAPLSYLINQAWLERLPNRVDFGPGTVLLGTFVLLLLGLITIGSQVIRVAISNPIEAVKSE